MKRRLPKIAAICIAIWLIAMSVHGQGSGCPACTATIAIRGHATDSIAVCMGSDSIHLYTTLLTCPGPYTYHWEISNDSGRLWYSIPSAVNDSFAVLPSDSGLYVFRYDVTFPSSTTGSTPGCSVVSNPIIIVVIPPPPTTFHISASATTVCVDSVDRFTGIALQGGNALSYQWQINGAPVGANVDTFASNTFSNGDQVSCILNTGLACSSPLLSNVITITLLPAAPLPSLTISASATTVCAGAPTFFSAQAVNGGSNPTYQWRVDNTIAGSNSATFIDSTINNSDLISCLLLSSNACSIPATSNALPITVNPLPTLTMPPEITIVSGTSVSLTPQVSIPVSTYSWTPPATLSNPAIASPTAKPDSNTTYQVTAETSAGCTASGKITVYVIKKLVMPSGFTPNGDGANDVFRIPPSEPFAVSLFCIYDRWGRLVFSTTDRSIGWDGSVGKDAAPVGTYVWIVRYTDPVTGKAAVEKGTVEVER